MHTATNYVALSEDETSRGSLGHIVVDGEGGSRVSYQFSIFILRLLLWPCFGFDSELQAFWPATY